MVWEKYEDVKNTILDGEQYLVHTKDNRIIILEYNDGIWYKFNNIIEDSNIINLLIPIDEIRYTLPDEIGYTLSLD